VSRHLFSKYFTKKLNYHLHLSKFGLDSTLLLLKSQETLLLIPENISPQSIIQTFVIAI